jgi:hypothetical protein
MPKWAPAPIALIVAALLIYRFEEAPSVQAAELLRKAVIAADAKPAHPRMIQIRTSHQQTRRLAGAQASGSGALEAMFASAHYDWQDPLSAKSYLEWRDQLSDKHDEVSEKNDGYVIRTATSSGPLTEATLRLSIPDLRPVEERLQFGDNEWVELTEVSPEAAAPSADLGELKQPSVKAQPDVAPNAAAPSVTPSPVPHTATIGDELQVLLALHQLNADLGDPIEVSRSGSQVLVTGMGIPAPRQQEIRNALASNASVVVRFSEPVAPATAAPSPHPEGAVNSDMAQLQARVAEKLGGRVNFDELSAQVLDLSDQMMSRAYALRRLAERFPSELDSSLGDSDRQILAGLRQEHLNALVQLSDQIDQILRPVFGSLGVDLRKTNPETGLSLNWQPATEEVFQSARQSEKLLAIMFGAASSDSSGPQIPTQLAASLAQLHARLGGYAKIGTEEFHRKD